MAVKQGTNDAKSIRKKDQTTTSDSDESDDMSGSEEDENGDTSKNVTSTD